MDRRTFLAGTGAVLLAAPLAVAVRSWGCLGRPASERVADYVAVTGSRGGAAAPRGVFMLPSGLKSGARRLRSSAAPR